MGTKNNPGNFDCYANAKPDEPMFVLLGRDPVAASLVRLWASTRSATGTSYEKLAEAYDCAESMENYCRGVERVPVVVLDHLPTAALRRELMRRCVNSPVDTLEIAVNIDSAKVSIVFAALSSAKTALMQSEPKMKMYPEPVERHNEALRRINNAIESLPGALVAE